jgi:hypothetical protein
MKEPKIGDPVLCDGRQHLITDRKQRYASETGALVAAVLFEDPQYRVYALERDLRWDAALGSWYLWGRCLSAEQMQVVVTLRDRGHLPARGTRQFGSAPAGGEHLNLYLALFAGKPRGFWTAAVAAAVTGTPLPSDVQGSVADYARRFAAPLPGGYADPDADDSFAPKGATP